MPKFKIKSPDGRTITIEATDQATAIRGAQEWAKTNPPARQQGVRYGNLVLPTGAAPTAPTRPATAQERRARPAPPPRRRGVAEDVGSAIPTGLAEGLQGMADMGSMNATANARTNIAQGRQQLAEAGYAEPSWLSGLLDVGQDPLAAIGLDYDPQTVAGEYARTGAQFASGALMPGSAGARALNVAVPAITTETSGQIARGLGADQQTEDVVRFIASLGGGVLAGARPRPGPPRLPPPESRPVVTQTGDAFRIHPQAVVRKASERLNRAVADDVAGGGPNRDALAASILRGERPWAAGGPNLAMLAEDAASQPGSARTRLELSARNVRDGVSGEVRGAIGQATGNQGDMLAHLDGIKAERLRNAAPLRDRAFASPIDPVAYRSQIEPIMPRVPQSALRLATEIAERDGRSPTELGLIAVRRNDGSGTMMDVQVRNPTMETLHFIKKGMDQDLARFRDPFGRLNLEGQPLAQATSSVRRDLGQAMRRVNSDYDKFMETWGDDSELASAYTLGGNALEGRGGLRSQELSRAHGEMSAQARDEYSRGVGDNLLDRLRQTGDVQTLRQLLKNEVFAERVRLAFPGNTFDDFMARADQIVKREAVANQILGNSRTGLRTALREEGQAPDPSGYIGDAMTMDPRSAARRGLGDAARATSGRFDWGNARAVRDLVGRAMDDPVLFDQVLNAAKSDPLIDPALLQGLERIKVEHFAPAAIGLSSRREDSSQRRPQPPR